MSDPAVSVIIPTYNRSIMLVRAIRSVLAQSCQDFEIIVVDDGSTDDTRIAVEGLKDERIKLYTMGTNSGGSYTPRLFGLRIARGKYIAALDDDSMWLHRHKLEMQVTFLDTHPDYVLVGTNAVSLHPDGSERFGMDYPVSDADIRDQILTRSCFLHPSVVYRSCLVKGVDGYRKFSIRSHEYYSNDYELWLRLGTHGMMINLPMRGVGIVLETKNHSLKSRISFAFSMLKTIREYRNCYPRYYRASVSWLFNLLLDTPQLRMVKRWVLKKQEKRIWR